MAVVVKKGITPAGAAVVIIKAGENKRVDALKITCGGTSARRIVGTCIVVFARCFAIAIAKFASLDEVVLAYRIAIIVVKAIAARGAALIAINTSGNSNVRAY